MDIPLRGFGRLTTGHKVGQISSCHHGDVVTTREDVERNWTALVCGELPRAEVAQWATRAMLEEDLTHDLMVALAVQRLSGFDLVIPAGRPGGLLADGTTEVTLFFADSPYAVTRSGEGTWYHADAEVSERYHEWKRECALYDVDPQAWRDSKRRG